MRYQIAGGGLPVCPCYKNGFFRLNSREAGKKRPVYTAGNLAGFIAAAARKKQGDNQRARLSNPQREYKTQFAHASPLAPPPARPAGFDVMPFDGISAEPDNSPEPPAAK